MRAYGSGRPEKSIALRYRVWVALALLLAAIFAANSARADGIINSAPPPLTTLVKFNERTYEIAYADSVSLDPVQTSVISKIGYGAVSHVNIATTETGTYSSDGLTSPYVRYPGITVSQVREDPVLPHWIGAPSQPGFSIYSLGRSPSGSAVINHVSDHGVRSCISRGSILSCYRTF